MRLMKAISIVLACALSAHAEEALPPNVVTNPGFEIAGDNGFPAGWSGSTAVYSRDTEIKRTGEASLKHVNTDPERYVLCSTRVELEPGRMYDYRVWVRTEGVEGGDTGAGICIEYSGPDGKYMGGWYPAGIKGDNDWTEISGTTGRVPEKAVSFVLHCYLRRGVTGTAWWDDIELRPHRKNPLDGVLISPNYRDEVTDAGPRRARVMLEVDLIDYAQELADVTLAWEVAPLDGGRPAAEGRIKRIKDKTVEVSFPAMRLAPGDYRIEIALQDRHDGQILSTWTQALRRTAGTPARAVTIDEHNRLIVDGEPFFPLGMYWGGVAAEQLEIYADSAFNCLMPYGALSREQMDMIHQRGLKVIYSVKDCYYGTQWCPKEIASQADEVPFVQSKVDAFREHPALLAWYINDELPVTMIDRLSARRTLMEELDPGHPTWVVLYQIDEVRRYIPSFHAIGTDPYPINTRPVAQAGDWTRRTLDAVAGARPVWMVPQVFNWAVYKKEHEGRSELRAPTADEIRSMVWQCIAEGANGVVMYSWFDLHRDTSAPFEQQWAIVKAVAQEVEGVIPALLSLQKPEAVDGPSELWLNWTTRRFDGTTFLIAVNNTEEPRRATFRLGRRARHVTRRGGEAIPVWADGAIDLLFAPLEVYVCEITRDR